MLPYEPGFFRDLGILLADEQIISDPLPLAQAEALETSLIQQAIAEGRTIYNVKPQSISPLAPVQVPRAVPPSQSFLNYQVYPR